VSFTKIPNQVNLNAILAIAEGADTTIRGITGASVQTCIGLLLVLGESSGELDAKLQSEMQKLAVELAELVRGNIHDMPSDSHRRTCIRPGNVIVTALLSAADRLQAWGGD
jgi:hypothetical protein